MSSFVFWGGPGWDNGTIWLYVSISCLSGLLAFLSKQSKSTTWNLVPYVFSSLSLVLFKGICVSGADIRFGGGYYFNFLSAMNLDSFRDKSVELGYQLFTIFIRNLTDSYEVYLLFISLVSIIPPMFVLWRLRENINLPFAVMGYSLIFIITGISAMRQFIAVGFCMLAGYLYFQERFKPAIFTWLVAISFHISALCFLLMFILGTFGGRRLLQAGIAAGAIGVCLVASPLISSFFTGRYAGYSVSETIGFGSSVIYKYAPILLAMLFLEARSKRTSSYSKARVECFSRCWTVLLFAICIALIGYIVPIFGRAESFSVLIVVAIAYLISVAEEERYFRLPLKNLFFMYFCFRLLLYMNDSYLTEGLMPYQTWLF